MMQTQRRLTFDGPEVLVRLSDSDREFMRITPLDQLPESFWIMTRAMRLKCSESDLRNMRSYELSRELAEERALAVNYRYFTIARPTILDRQSIDAAARRQAREHIELFKEFLKSRSA